MKLKVQQPLPERKDVFDESVKPLLLAAESNNALDKWMYNLKDDGKPNLNSVVFVSSKHKKMFIIEGIYATEQPKIIPTLKTSENQTKQSFRKGKRGQTFYERMRSRSKKFTKQPNKTEDLKHLDALQTWGRSKSKYINVLETWTASIGYWDLADSWYPYSSFSVESGSNIPTLK